MTEPNSEVSESSCRVYQIHTCLGLFVSCFLIKTENCTYYRTTARPVMIAAKQYNSESIALHTVQTILSQTSRVQWKCSIIRTTRQHDMSQTTFTFTQKSLPLLLQLFLGHLAACNTAPTSGLSPRLQQKTYERTCCFVQCERRTFKFLPCYFLRQCNKRGIVSCAFR